VLHYALTKVEIEQIEAVQKRAIHIVLNFSRGMPYMVVLSAANLTTLASHISQILLACITSPQIQEITRSFLG